MVAFYDFRESFTNITFPMQYVIVRQINRDKASSYYTDTEVILTDANYTKSVLNKNWLYQNKMSVKNFFCV